MYVYDEKETFSLPKKLHKIMLSSDILTLANQNSCLKTQIIFSENNPHLQTRKAKTKSKEFTIKTRKRNSNN